MKQPSRRTRIKICGITTRADAEAAIACGCDALGLNTWTAGSRYIDLEREAFWIREVPPLVSKVAVLVNMPVADALSIAARPEIDLLQLHGDEDPAYCRELAASGARFIKAVRPRSALDLSHLREFGSDVFLIDAYVPGAFGGTGTSGDQTVLRKFASLYPQWRMIVAGGLKPNNVRELVAEVRPYAVDVCSGVESAPGRKDAALLEAFTLEVRAGDAA